MKFSLSEWAFHPRVSHQKKCANVKACKYSKRGRDIGESFEKRVSAMCIL